MIENVPTAGELRTVSLRLYFKAWSEVTAIVTDWKDFGGPVIPSWSHERGHLPADENAGSNDETSKDWREYITSAQNDLQGIYTLIQQSQEIGLKAQICEISPFLLLKRTDIKPSDPIANTWDFTDFPTIDAAELIRVQHVFCPTVLSKDFQNLFEKIRRNRNKIYHLGIYKSALDPSEIIDILQMHYAELYPGRRWMEDRLHFATLHRWANYVHDDYNERTSLFNELWELLPGLSEKQYEWIMGHGREKRRFICFSCSSDANLGDSQPYGSDVPTAFRLRNSFKVRCVICDGVYKVESGSCARDDCESTLISGEEESFGRCMTCGWNRQDWKEHQEETVKQRASGSRALESLLSNEKKGDET